MFQHPFPASVLFRLVCLCLSFGALAPATFAGGSHSCCLSNGACTIVGTSADCTVLGGVYVISGGCSPQSCAGACCAFDGTCTVTTFDACAGTTPPFGPTVAGDFRGPGTTCGPNTCLGACCNTAQATCTLAAPSNCAPENFRGVGSVCGQTTCPSGACCTATGACSIIVPSQCAPGNYRGDGTVCFAATCRGACCLTAAGTCSQLSASQCESNGGVFGGFGAACTPAFCPNGACCASSGACSLTGPTGCEGTYKGDGSTCSPTFPCPPVVVLRNIVLDGNASCIDTNIPAGLFDDGSTTGAPQPCALTFTASPPGPYGVGGTIVTITVTDCFNNSATGTAIITIDAPDCNQDGVNDLCECFWENVDLRDNCRGCRGGTGPGGYNGQLSHIGGGANFGSRVADDFFVCAGQMSHIYGFRGLMLTNSVAPVRKARLEFYEDCDGVPAATPFKVYTKSVVVGSAQAADNFDLVLYGFDFCDDPLWLEGGKCGKTYWVSLQGLSDNAMGMSQDVSFWLTAPGFDEIKGSIPHKAVATAGPRPTQIWDPWVTGERCCGGCANMAFSLQGETCICLWNNGAADLDPATRGGSSSGAAGAGATARTADNFVVRPCDPVEVCLIEAWVWTNCVPPHAFIEIYENDCKTPTLTIPATVVPEVEAIDEQVSATIDGVTYKLYRLRAAPDGFVLDGGKTYWLSAGVNGGGSLLGRSLFAYATDDCRPCPILISPGMKRALTPVLAEEWTTVSPARDFAFRVFVHEEPVMHMIATDDAPAALPTCRADFDGSGAATVDDLFLYLNAWFAGCP